LKVAVGTTKYIAFRIPMIKLQLGRRSALRTEAEYHISLYESDSDITVGAMPHSVLFKPHHLFATWTTPHD